MFFIPAHINSSVQVHGCHFLLFVGTVKGIKRLNPQPAAAKGLLFPFKPSLEAAALVQQKPDIHEDSIGDSINTKCHDKNPDYNGWNDRIVIFLKSLYWAWSVDLR